MRAAANRAESARGVAERCSGREPQQKGTRSGICRARRGRLPIEIGNHFTFKLFHVKSPLLFRSSLV
jgi:hypothetical protein